ncbi:hypothetical protein BDN70DRAFT_808333 [Pholiota conissans]|uniref:Uncharacterized protein n=1 Tax=Pholiota conissans TaxID=109636 RepID=A0A9P6CTP9_9AGAR|nr:hypothetical protein BDN70DRAFT_808333 [Pholiota conissans]
MVEGVSKKATWSMFYHFFLDKISRNILIAQCHTLIAVSVHTEMWNSCKYGKFM